MASFETFHLVISSNKNLLYLKGDILWINTFKYIPKWIFVKSIKKSALELENCTKRNPKSKNRTSITKEASRNSHKFKCCQRQKFQKNILEFFALLIFFLKKNKCWKLTLAFFNEFWQEEKYCSRNFNVMEIQFNLIHWIKIG